MTALLRIAMDMRCIGIPLLCVTALFSLPAPARELVVLVDTGTEMPMARFENDKLVDGIHKDIGDELAHRLGRTARFVAMPRKRLASALNAGAADVLCSYVPEWLEGSFDWSTPFIPIDELLISDRRFARPRSLADLAGQPIGTVLGYSHPELEAVLGKDFVRENAPTSEVNLRKLAAGRIHYAVLGKAFLEYRIRLGDPPLTLHPPLPVKTYMGRCAVSRSGHVTVREINGAIDQIVKDGAMLRIARRYQ